MLRNTNRRASSSQDLREKKEIKGKREHVVGTCELQKDTGRDTDEQIDTFVAIVAARPP